MKTIKFKKGNKIKYGQDFQQWTGVPSDVEFTVVKGTDDMAILSAPGYGGKPYGNGQIFIYRNMNEKSKGAQAT